MCCSDGATLCGLYIAADSVMDMIDTEKEVDVFYTVQQAKSARPEFITTEVGRVSNIDFDEVWYIEYSSSTLNLK